MDIGTSIVQVRAVMAARQAVLSPLLENVSIEGAKGVLVNITGNKNVTMFEVREFSDYNGSSTSTQSHVFYGQVFDESLEDRLKVTVIATGFPPKVARGTKAPISAMKKLQPVSAGVSMPQPATPSSIDDDLKRPAY